MAPMHAEVLKFQLPKFDGIILAPCQSFKLSAAFKLRHYIARCLNGHTVICIGFYAPGFQPENFVCFWELLLNENSEILSSENCRVIAFFICTCTKSVQPYNLFISCYEKMDKHVKNCQSQSHQPCQIGFYHNLVTANSNSLSILSILSILSKLSFFRLLKK